MPVVRQVLPICAGVGAGRPRLGLEGPDSTDLGIIRLPPPPNIKLRALEEDVHRGSSTIGRS